MYAIVSAGGKQYRVEVGSVLSIERVYPSGSSVLPEAGHTVELPNVLLLGDGSSTTIGEPYVAGASVVGTVVAHKRGPKLTIFKKLRRKGKRLKKGHRQELMTVKISSINTGK